MKVLITISILLMAASTTDVAVSDQCNCEKLLSQADCKAKQGCSWSTTTSLCSKLDSGSSSTEGYCGLITDAITCAKTKGCAYLDSVCQIFAGCSAYKGATDAECQAISKQCNSDGTAFCVDPGTCTTYKTAEDCTGKGSSGGSGTCVWDTSCREQKCTEADIAFNSDAQCNNFIKGCVTTGKGCVTSLGLCSTYSGDVESCEGLKGSDGYCKGVDGKDKCVVKVCTDAETTLNSDTACAKYQIGCVTNGYGCVKSPLGSCSTQTGDDVVCANKTGSDGKCKGVAEGKTCSVVDCKDAPETYSTDTECGKYKSGCVTTGKGCATSKGTCSSYKGTSSTCDGYIGSDGKCKGASDAEAACSAKVCKDADASLNSDAKCDEYQTGCKTTGKGCVSTLSTCSSYTGDSTSCDGYIGTDGKCAGGASSGSCFPKKCSDALASLTTNEDCNNYQTGCIATGTGGCMDAGACSTLLNNSQCDGKSTCQWTPQCVSNVACSDLKSEILCKTVVLQNKNTCWWVSGTCVARTCDQAPNTYNTDSLCDAFLKGCLTKKTGCIASTATCSSYSGTKATCEGFTIKCTNTNSASDTTACVDPVCTDNTDATSDDACKSYHSTCLTKGTGCIAASAACSAYPGTSTDICGKFTGSNQANPCWWKSGANCVDKACADADNTNTTDDLCGKFLKGCVTTGAGCIAGASSCGDYPAMNQAGCAALSKGCARREACTAEATCASINGATNQASCDAVLPNRCLFINNSCVIIGACSSYSGSSVAACKDLYNASGAKCYWTTGSNCADRACSQIANPADLKACTDHKSTCARKSDGSVCEDYVCTNVTSPTAETSCQNYHPLCHFGKVSNTDACTVAATCGAYSPSSSGTCPTAITAHGGSCKANTTAGNPCIDDVCSAYNASATDCKAKKVAYATAFAGSATAQYCFHTGSACVEKSCASANTHLGVTVSSFSQCNTYFDLCVYSKPTTGAVCVNGNNADGSSSGCALVQGTKEECLTLTGKYKNASNVWEYRLCYSHNSAGTAACADRLCSQKSDGTTDAICQAWLPTCKTNGEACVDIQTGCGSMTGTSESCQLLTGLVLGSKCQGNTSVNGTCVVRRCQDNGIATTDADCKKYLDGCITTGKGCISATVPCSGQWGNQDGCKQLTGNSKQCWSLSLTTKGACIDRTCAHNTTATTDSDCATFMKGCVTKRPGCIEATAECSSYQGVQADCEKAVGNGKSCTNDSTATATTSCKVKDCTKLAVDSYTESVCQAYGIQCHYNGSKCDVISTCSSLKGNFITCAQYVASDGPCIGTALQTDTPTSCTAAKCSDAPITLTTDADCNSYKTGCKTNGHGCGASVACADVQSSSSCTAVKSGNDFLCAWASQCRDVQTSCSSFTASGQSVCASSESTSGFGICIWKNSACTEAKCEDLPLTVGSETDCTGYSNTCTFAGAGNGCVTKGACTGYTRKEVCSAAKSTDSIGSCTWDETIVTGTQIKGCRAKDCQDAAVTLVNDADCDAFISGCVSNGAGCMKSTFTCDMYKTQAKCLQDSSLQPCLWNNNACQQYYKCADLSLKTVTTCQAASKYCTTDESKCTPLKICSNYTKQIQCLYGTDGTCGWVTSTKKCQLFTQCTDLVSKVSSECTAFNTKCISNGTNCIDMAECSTYADSEAACKIGGTDGTCQFDKDTSACRLRQCSDASTSTSTHNGCYGYQINPTSKCTTDGSKCISLADCASYTKQAGCVIDSSFKACVWDTTAKTCKTKTCSDTKKTKSSECAAALTGCISDGTKCIDQGKCADYTTKEACGAGGTDGTCAFTPASGSTTTGTCKLFSQCSDANSDQNACQLKSLTCKWTAAVGTTASSCSNHTCDSAAKGTNKCVTIPSFDGKRYTVCQVQGGKCVTGDPSALTQDNCYKMSQYTYSWNASTKKCIACGAGASNNNNNNTTVDNNQTNTTDPTTTGHGFYLYAMSILITLMF
ncbi:unnamed protein product (macronuclear) [Paramecium tetraurelia]|uniref:PSI domain-containing protein n=1 Tax=Paramecium tetraurelia TaxID=5888 RepID=A0BUZ4_PARTE|nr:uncharacterized protein GSPATT00005607001 [Paramecium tetraurelia]CAK62361.1 unnamed protein product [Paramecium tetraurelia]|eukprot:XP_001429759.1 hypothetical protein (macronuclear) [Paramecium tetraurelia strain d4-2]